MVLLPDRRGGFACTHHSPVRQKRSWQQRKEGFTFRKWPSPRVTDELVLRDLAPAGVQGVGYVGERSLIVVTKGVRAMVSTDWSG